MSRVGTVAVLFALALAAGNAAAFEYAGELGQRASVPQGPAEVDGGVGYVVGLDEAAGVASACAGGDDAGDAGAGASAAAGGPMPADAGQHEQACASANPAGTRADASLLGGGGALLPSAPLQPFDNEHDINAWADPTGVHVDFGAFGLNGHEAGPSGARGAADASPAGVAAGADGGALPSWVAQAGAAGAAAGDGAVAGGAADLLAITDASSAAALGGAASPDGTAQGGASAETQRATTQHSAAGAGAAAQGASAAQAGAGAGLLQGQPQASYADAAASSVHGTAAALVLDLLAFAGTEAATHVLANAASGYDFVSTHACTGGALLAGAAVMFLGVHPGDCTAS